MISHEPIKQIQPDILTEVGSEGRTNVQKKKRIEPEREDLTEPDNGQSVTGKDDKTVVYSILREGNIKAGSSKDNITKMVSDKNLQICPENFRHMNQDLKIFSQDNDDNNS